MNLFPLRKSVKYPFKFNSNQYFTQSTSKMSACRWGVELWDCLDQAVTEVAIHNSFLNNTCSKYIRYVLDGMIMYLISG